MNDVPVKQRSINCGICKTGRSFTIPKRLGNNSRYRSSRYANRNRRRAIHFVQSPSGELIPLCKACGRNINYIIASQFGKANVNVKLYSISEKWDEYVVQSTMDI